MIPEQEKPLDYLWIKQFQSLLAMRLARKQQLARIHLSFPHNTEQVGQVGHRILVTSVKIQDLGQRYFDLYGGFDRQVIDTAGPVQYYYRKFCPPFPPQPHQHVCVWVLYDVLHPKIPPP